MHTQSIQVRLSLTWQTSDVNFPAVSWSCGLKSLRGPWLDRAEGGDMNIRSSCRAVVVSALMSVLLTPVLVQGQLPSNGEVTGSVMDASGAAVPGASVSLIDTATSAAHVRTSQDDLDQL